MILTPPPAEPSAEEASLAGTGPAGKTSLGRAVGSGVAWGVLYTGTAKVLSFLSLIVLGYLLTEDDFGTYALAMSIAVFVQCLRDGGVREILVQRGAAAYSQLASTVFWLAMAFNLLAGFIIVAIAPFGAARYDEPRVEAVLIVLAFSLPLSTPATVLNVRLRMDLRFKPIAYVHIASAFVRYGGVVLLAFLGLGPLSFVLPLLAVALFELAAYASITRSLPWTGPAHLTLWPELLKPSMWMMVGAGAVALNNFGDYVVSGAIISTAVVGIYFFGYQLTSQSGVLLAENIWHVLLPAMSRLKDERQRQRQAAARAIGSIVLAVAPVSVGLTAIIKQVEAIIWHGRWADAVVVVQLLSAIWTLRLVLRVAALLLVSWGHFRAYALMILLQATGLVGVAAVGALVGVWMVGSPDAHAVAGWIAAAVAAYFTVTCPLATWWIVQQLGITGSQLARLILPGWLSALAALGAAWGVSALVSSVWPANDFVFLALNAAVFTLVFAGLVRGFLTDELEDLIQVAPRRIATILRFALHLPKTALPRRPTDSAPVQMD